MSKYEEFLTPEEIREIYGLQEDEDLYKFIKELNNTSKGTRIVIISKEGDNYDQD